MVKKETENKMKGLTLEFIPYSEIRDLNSAERIKKLLAIVLNSRIIILQGRLKPDEEVRLIEDTMAIIGHVKNFKGIELAVVGNGSDSLPIFRKLTTNVAKFLVGDTAAMTIIGPASIVKEIKKNPRKIELMLNK